MFATTEYDSPVLRSVLRYLAWAMLSMGIFTLFSGGLNVVSSALVIALGQQWLQATSMNSSLKSHLEDLQLLSDKDCRGCCRNCCTGQCRGVLDNIRGLAISAITFGVIELIVYMPYLSVMGVILTFWQTPYLYSSAGYCSGPSATTYVDGKTYTCNTNSQVYCTINYPPQFTYSPSSSSFQCYTGTTFSQCSVSLPYRAYANTPQASVYGNYCYTSSSYTYDSASTTIGQWLFYAVGHTAIAAPLNIAWGALTLNLIAALTTKARTGLADERTSLLPGRVETKPVFMSQMMMGATGEGKA